jgi:hypothetical protein
MYIITPQFSPSNNVSYARSSNKGIHLGGRPSAWDNVKESNIEISTLESETSRWCSSFGEKKTSQWYGFTTQKKRDNSYTTDKT